MNAPADAAAKARAKKLVDEAVKIPPVNGTSKEPAPPFSLDITEIADLYRPPDLVYGLAIQRGRVHAMTSPTNHGKTAIVSTIIPAVAFGMRIGVDEVHTGKVLALVGENPEDFYGRMLATLGELNIPIERLKDRVRIIPHSFRLVARLDEVRAVAQSMGETVLVVVDTNASYYGYDDEIDNVQQRQQAADLRELTRLPGNPAVVATCHPVKNPSRENLMPRGGGGFLNEIDTNLTVWKESDVATLHFQHKIRGPSFEPIKFALKMCPVPGQLDAKGNRPQTVVAVPLTDAQAEIIEHKSIQDENKLLLEIQANPRASIATWAERLGWMTNTGAPLKSRVHRMLGSLERTKLVKKSRGGKYNLTTEGKKALDEL